MDEIAIRACARSQVYGFLALGFGYPDAARLDQLRRQGKRLEKSLATLGETVGLEAARRIITLLAALTLSELLEAHVGCFGHAISKECPPYEAEYGQSHIFQMTQTLADIAGFYRAFGLQTAPNLCERLDHVSVELEFMHFLCLKEGHAVEKRHGAERIAQCREAQAKFLREHLGRWALGFARRVQNEATGCLYERLCELLHAFVIRELAALGADAAAIAHLELSMPGEDGSDSCVDCQTGAVASG